MPSEDRAIIRMIQREISRRNIDSTKIDVKASHGIVFLRGEVRKLRGHDVNLKDEMEIIRRLLRGKQGIRDVHVDDVVIRS
jgi:osmotically-inducible protein OsmY